MFSRITLASGLILFLTVGCIGNRAMFFGVVHVRWPDRARVRLSFLGWYVCQYALVAHWQRPNQDNLDRVRGDVDGGRLVFHRGGYDRRGGSPVSGLLMV